MGYARRRAVIAGAALLFVATGASASVAALHRSATPLPASPVVVTLQPAPSEPATADFPAWTPTPAPTATPTPVASVARVAKATPKPTAKPAPSNLEECNPSIFQETPAAVRQANGTVLIEMVFHRTWPTPPCSMPTGCKLGYTVRQGMGGLVATNQPVNCTPTYTLETQTDFRLSVLWSTCHPAGDYGIAVRLDWEWFDAITYTAKSAEPPGCPSS